MLPAIQAGLFALPVLAQFGQGLAGQALILLRLDFFQRGVGGGFCLFGEVDRCGLRGELTGGGSEFLFQFLLRLLLRGEVAAQLGLLLELLAPDAEAFAELGALRLGGAEVVDLFGFSLAELQGLLRLRGDCGAVVLGSGVLGELFSLQFFARGVQGFEFVFAVLAGGTGLLPLQVQRFEGFGRFAGGELCQFGRGGA